MKYFIESFIHRSIVSAMLVLAAVAVFFDYWSTAGNITHNIFGCQHPDKCE